MVNLENLKDMAKVIFAFVVQAQADQVGVRLISETNSVRCAVCKGGNYVSGIFTWIDRGDAVVVVYGETTSHFQVRGGSTGNLRKAEY
jgi:hypothetical protein